ncbi:MAG: Nramp family divalent metal transporter [Solitalea-like symbiont of Acarus siro]
MDSDKIPGIKFNPSLSEVNQSIKTAKGTSKIKKILSFLGPAYLISVGYMDPGNWATDIAGGSQFGYQLIWVLLLSNVMALVLQSLSSRLGLVKGLDLAQISRLTYPKIINIPLYILAEIAIAACDLAEIIGMAIGLQLLFDLPLIYGILITALDTFVILLLMNRGIRLLEMFIIAMVFIIGASFIINLFIVSPSVPDILQGFKPTMLSNQSVYIAIGIIGATVMPHNLYLHSSLVQTRKFDRTTNGIRSAIKYNFLDTTIALNLAFFVNAAILILAAAAFHKNGFYEIAEIQDAYKLLNSLFGSLAPILFAVALIVSGQSSTITGTLAGQIVMEGYLNLRIRPWLRRLITRSIAIAPALIAIIYFGDSSLGKLLILSQVVLSLQLGFAIIPLIHFCSNKLQMKDFAIGLKTQIAAWLIAFIIIVLNIKLVIEEIQNWITASNPNIFLASSIIIVCMLITGLLAYIIFSPFVKSIIPSRALLTPHTSKLANNFTLGKNLSYNKIAVTVDFSIMDTTTLQHAISLGGKNSSYLLIHIVETAPARYIKSEIFDYETISDKATLTTYVDYIKSQGYKCDFKIGYGNLVSDIKTIIEEVKANLLIMGAHGHKLVKDMLLGSTIDSLRHKLNIPILIVTKRNE